MHSSHPEHRHGDHGHAQACGHAHGHAHLLPDGGLDRAMAIGVGLNALFVVSEIVTYPKGAWLRLCVPLVVALLHSFRVTGLKYTDGWASVTVTVGVCACVCACVCARLHARS